MAQPRPNVAQLSRLASDVKAQTTVEGRMPVAVMLLFEEPTKASQAAVRVVEYARDERSERVISATADASKPARPVPKPRRRRGSSAAAHAARSPIDLGQSTA
jgi:hypothetical protein